MMEFKQTYKRISEFTGKMLSEPKTFWDKVIEEKDTIEILNQFYIPYTVVTALVCAIGTVISSSEVLMSYAILKGLREAVVYMLQFYISVFIIDKLNVFMGGKKDKKAVEIIVGFTMFPFFLVSILTGVFPYLYIVNVLGIYGLYLFFTGVPKLFDLPENKVKAFSFVAILTNFFIFAFLSLLFWKLFEAYY